MKTIVKYILAVSVLILFQNCKKSDDNACCGQPYVKNHYIQFFMSDLKEDGIFISAIPNLVVNEEQKTIDITNHNNSTQCNYLLIRLSFKNIYSRSSVQGQVNRYEEYAELIGDNHYPLNLLRSWHFNYPDAIVDKFESVKIFTDEDYTADFPAGSDVSSLFNIYFEDPLRTIQNNYQSVTAEDAYQNKEYVSNEYWKAFPHTITGNTLSEIDFSQKNFIGSKWFLMPNQKPDILGEYTFTIEITTNDGRVITKKTPFTIN
ncbi:hypothetical protein [Myroides indicus]|uniref:Uncharacterized protein n=1 Tax=Myroides indicus TaxID=1323422 RepID=A0A4R7ERM8_9FLAO|nr:hypothetical protein [Myroides indicus]TDS51455.1 hypothetical protein C8P70_13713 [Myroides indicus]